MRRFLIALPALALSSCLVQTSDAGCATYAMRRLEIPRPIGEGPLPRWVAVTDAAMTGTCRKGVN